MAAPSVTGFSIISDSEAGWSTPAAGIGLSGADVTAFGTPYGNGMRLRGSNSGPGLYAAQISRTLNLTTLQGLTVLHNINQSQGLAATADNGILIGFADTSNNYSLWRIRSSDQGQSGYIFSVISGATPPAISSPAPANLSNITRVLAAYTSTETNSIRPIVIFDQFGTIGDVAVINGEASNQASFLTFVDYFSPVSLASISPFNGVIVFRIPITVRAEYFRSSDRTVVFETFNSGYNVSTNYHSLRFQLLTSTASHVLNRVTLFSGSNVDISFGTADSYASATAQFNQVNVSAAGNTSIYSPAMLSGGYESGRTLVRYHSGVVGNRELIDSPLQIECTPGQDLSALNFSFSGTTRSLRLNPSSGGTSQIDLTGIESAGSLSIDNVTVNSITILVSEALSYTVASPTTGGGSVTVIQPQQEIQVVGLPNVAGVRLAVRDLSTQAVSYPTVTAGAATVPSVAGTSYRLMADAPGYGRQAANVDGATPSFEFSLPDYSAYYNPAAASPANIAFNYSTLATLVSDGLMELPFEVIFSTIEDYLATEQGVLFEFPPFPVVIQGRQFLVFPYDTIQDRVNPVVIRPDPANSSDPTITDCVLVKVGAADPIWDMFDFSAAGGRVIRIQTNAVAARVEVSGGLSSEDRAILASTAQDVGSVLALAEADEQIRDEVYRKLRRGTADVLLEKAVTQAGTSIDLIEP